MHSQVAESADAMGDVAQASSVQSTQRTEKMSSAAAAACGSCSPTFTQPECTQLHQCMLAGGSEPLADLQPGVCDTLQVCTQQSDSTLQRAFSVESDTHEAEIDWSHVEEAWATACDPTTQPCPSQARSNIQFSVLCASLVICAYMCMYTFSTRPCNCDSRFCYC